MTDIQQRIRDQIAGDNIVLYMKGTPVMPRCGFSKQVADILQSYHVPFTAYDVLEDEELRQGIKTFSQWPTIPQVYIHENFIGGCDIIMSMHQDGELMKLLGS